MRLGRRLPGFLVALMVISNVFVMAGCNRNEIGSEKSKDVNGNNVVQTDKPVSNNDTKDKLLEGVKVLKHSSLRFAGDKTIYFDPFKLEGEPHDADIIFITHTHYDHFSTEDIKKLAKEDTTIVITSDGADLLDKDVFKKQVSVEPGKEYEIDGLKVRTVPAYNVDKDYHPKSENWVGYILNINNLDYYIAGDTDYTPEMKEIKADVAFLPVGGTYTTDAKEAAQAANVIKPKIAVPIHYGEIIGDDTNAESFIKLLDEGIKGVILKAKE